MSGATDLDTYLRARRAEIDTALDRFLPAAPACPPQLAEAMRYCLLGGGKRLRPILTLAAAEAVAAPDTGRGLEAHARTLALPAACAIEMVHTYSLIHDDLPAMDNDTLRRGRPTAHVVYGEALAILAGDALLTEAFGLLAREPATTDADLMARKLRIAARIAAAAGAGGMVGGQAIDLSNAALDAAEIQTLHARKTGALISAAASAGAIMGGGAEATIGAIDRYATELGLAFQIVDDILDVEGRAEELGKTAGKDEATGKATYVTLYGVAESRRLARACVERARATLEGVGLGGRLSDIAQWVLERDR